MEIRFEDKKVLKFDIEADMKSGYDEITPFVSAMKKVAAKSKKPGFSREFNKNERVVLNAIWDKIMPYDATEERNNTKTS